MNVGHGGAHFDWPLSRDEKKYHIMQLYDKELKAVSASTALKRPECTSQVFPEDVSDGAAKVRRSDASTAETELSTVAESFGDDQLDQLDTISEELGNAMQRSGPDGQHVDLEDEHAKNAAKHLREAVAEAVTVLQEFSRRAQGNVTPRTSQGDVAGAGAPLRRAFSEEISRAARRPSLGRREGQQRRLSRSSKGDAQSRCTTPIRERDDSDGEDADIEDMHDRAEIRPVRRGRRSLVHEQCSVPPQHFHGHNDPFARSKSVPPERKLESIENFLGLAVPACPF